MEQTLRLQTEHGRVSPEAQTWYTGALGEIAVGGLLALLGPGWTVLHSVPVGANGTDIDHVVIGRAGVFTLNTKSHVGQRVWVGGHGVLISGRRTNYVAKAAAEAARAERALTTASGLTVPVTPVIVLVSPGERTVRAPAERGVAIVADTELLALLGGGPVFSEQQVDRIVAAAVVPATWDAPEGTELDGRALALQFNAIMARAQQVGSAPDRPSGPRAGSRPPVRRRRAADRRRSDALAGLALAGLAVWALLSGVVPALAR